VVQKIQELQIPIYRIGCTAGLPSLVYNPWSHLQIQKKKTQKIVENVYTKSLTKRFHEW